MFPQGLAFVPLPVTPTYNATKAAIHSYTESLRVQLTATPIQVMELVPPAVQTDLFGLAESEHAMPLVDYLDEVMGILRDQPAAREILVKKRRVPALRGGPRRVRRGARSLQRPLRHSVSAGAGGMAAA